MTEIDPALDSEITVGNCNDLDAGLRERVHELFERTYSGANHAYLDHSMSVLGWIAVAERDRQLLGFALADVVLAAIPRMDDPQVVTLGGLGCIVPEERRTGLFGAISGQAARANGLLQSHGSGQSLACGRMGHPVGFRSMLRFPTAIPRAGHVFSEWHLEVGAAVADLFGVRLKPGSFVVEGAGSPIGQSNVAIDVHEDEWKPFEGVDRNRGDSLLGLAWVPESPPNWF